MSALAELEALQAKVAEAQRRAKTLADEEKAAAAELKTARANLAKAEVDDPTGKQITAARRHLEAARQAVEVEPWAERRALAQRATGGAQAAVTRYAQTHLLDLAEELGEQADSAADAVNEAGRRFLDAALALHEVRQQAIATLHLGLPGAGRFIPSLQSDGARLAIEAFLDEGETPPRLDLEAAGLLERTEVA